MTADPRTLTALEVTGKAGMMLPVDAVMCCRMCA